MYFAGWTGLEPAASGVTGRRYNQLNYHPNISDIFCALRMYICSAISFAKRPLSPPSFCSSFLLS
jgi:hypothetical protein